MAHRAPSMRWPERLARAGFRIAFAGGLVEMAALVVPEWRPTGVVPSMAQLLLQPVTGPSGPTCVDCGGHRLDGLIFLWGLYGAILALLAASQAFRQDLPDTASGIASLGLLLGLGPLIPAAWGLVSSITAPGYAGAGGQAAPNWSAHADSLLWLALAGVLLVTIGNAIAVVGLLRRLQAVRVDWDALR